MWLDHQRAQARRGDYAERVAQKFGIPTEQLLNANLPQPAAANSQFKQLMGVAKDDPGAWLEGRLLTVCGARPATTDKAPGEVEIS
jgi:hypothetical protein